LNLTTGKPNPNTGGGGKKNRFVDREEVLDGDDKVAYDSAVTVWAIFLVIIIVATTAIFYLWIKNRKQMVTEVQTLQDLTSTVGGKRSELEE
jgi:hypothetical protein